MSDNVCPQRCGTYGRATIWTIIAGTAPWGGWLVLLTLRMSSANDAVKLASVKGVEKKSRPVLACAAQQPVGAPAAEQLASHLNLL